MPLCDHGDAVLHPMLLILFKSIDFLYKTREKKKARDPLLPLSLLVSIATSLGATTTTTTTTTTLSTTTGESPLPLVDLVRELSQLTTSLGKEEYLEFNQSNFTVSSSFLLRKSKGKGEKKDGVEIVLDFFNVEIEKLNKKNKMKKRGGSSGEGEEEGQPPAKIMKEEEEEVTSVDDLLRKFKKDSYFTSAGRIHFLKKCPGRMAIYPKEEQMVTLEKEEEDLLRSLNGNRTIYSHQNEALKHLLKEEGEGRKVLLSTSTASGKSLVYQFICLNEVRRNEEACCLLIFPTKALAQDQAQKLRNLALQAGLPSCRIEILDGDSRDDSPLREQIRDHANIILTNFDTIHSGVLPCHARWDRVLRNLKVVVVDEVHYYTGSLGLQCSLVLARLRRICKEVYQNTSFQFVGCSATLANPLSWIQRMFGGMMGEEECRVVSEDGSPSGMQVKVIFKNPIRPNSTKEGGTYTKVEEASILLRKLVGWGLRTLCFVNSRRECEVIQGLTSTALRNSGGNWEGGKVCSYRGGYTPEQRRKLERELREGVVQGCITTSALELGLDLGEMDVVLHVGAPVSREAYLQQLGRAGRRGKSSLSVLILDPNSRNDTRILECPEKLLDDVEAGGGEEEVDEKMWNSILGTHLTCGAVELPFTRDHLIYFSHLGKPVTEVELGRYLKEDRKGWIPRRIDGQAPSKSFAFLNPIRGISKSSFTLFLEGGGGGMVLEEVEASRMGEVFLEAIHLHQGKFYKVTRMDLSNMRGSCIPHLGGYITKAEFTFSFEMCRLEEEGRISRGCVCQLGSLEVRKWRRGYKKVHPVTLFPFETVETLEGGGGGGGEETYLAEGFWFKVPSIGKEVEMLKYFEALRTLRGLLLHGMKEKFPNSSGGIEVRVSETRIVFFDAGSGEKGEGEGKERGSGGSIKRILGVMKEIFLGVKERLISLEEGEEQDKEDNGEREEVVEAENVGSEVSKEKEGRRMVMGMLTSLL